MQSDGRGHRKTKRHYPIPPRRSSAATTPHIPADVVPPSCQPTPPIPQTQPTTSPDRRVTSRIQPRAPSAWQPARYDASGLGRAGGAPSASPTRRENPAEMQHPCTSITIIRTEHDSMNASPSYIRGVWGRRRFDKYNAEQSHPAGSASALPGGVRPPRTGRANPRAGEDWGCGAESAPLRGLVWASSHGWLAGLGACRGVGLRVSSADY